MVLISKNTVEEFTPTNLPGNHLFITLEFLNQPLPTQQPQKSQESEQQTKPSINSSLTSPQISELFKQYDKNFSDSVHSKPKTSKKQKKQSGIVSSGTYYTADSSNSSKNSSGWSIFGMFGGGNDEKPEQIQANSNENSDSNFQQLDEDDWKIDAITSQFVGVCEVNPEHINMTGILEDYSKFEQLEILSTEAQLELQKQQQQNEENPSKTSISSQTREFKHLVDLTTPNTFPIYISKPKPIIQYFENHEKDLKPFQKRINQLIFTLPGGLSSGYSDNKFFLPPTFSHGKFFSFNYFLIFKISLLKKVMIKKPVATASWFGQTKESETPKKEDFFFEKHEKFIKLPINLRNPAGSITTIYCKNINLKYLKKPKKKSSELNSLQQNSSFFGSFFSSSPTNNEEDDEKNLENTKNLTEKEINARKFLFLKNQSQIRGLQELDIRIISDSKNIGNMNQEEDEEEENGIDFEKKQRQRNFEEHEKVLTLQKLFHQMKLENNSNQLINFAVVDENQFLAPKFSDDSLFFYCFFFDVGRYLTKQNTEKIVIVFNENQFICQLLLKNTIFQTGDTISGIIFFSKPPQTQQNKIKSPSTPSTKKPTKLQQVRCRLVKISLIYKELPRTIYLNTKNESLNSIVTKFLDNEKSQISNSLNSPLPKTFNSPTIKQLNSPLSPSTIAPNLHETQTQTQTSNIFSDISGVSETEIGTFEEITTNALETFFNISIPKSSPPDFSTDLLEVKHFLKCKFVVELSSFEADVVSNSPKKPSENLAPEKPRIEELTWYYPVKVYDPLMASSNQSNSDTLSTKVQFTNLEK